MGGYICACMCVCVCVRACVHAWVHSCLRACVCIHVHNYVAVQKCGFQVQVNHLTSRSLISLYPNMHGGKRKWSKDYSTVYIQTVILEAAKDDYSVYINFI